MLLPPLTTNTALYKCNQIKAIEQDYARLNQNTTYPLMEAAGNAACQQIDKLWPQTKQLLVVTGKGNNAGDGFVVARLAALAKKNITVIMLVEPQQLKGDALIAYQKLVALTQAKSNVNLVIETLDNEALDNEWINPSKIQSFDVIVDAILGTGLKGVIGQPFKQIIQLLNQAQRPILSIDLPSGLDANTGQVVSCAIRAEATITFVGIKQGLLTHEGVDYCGQISLADLAITEQSFVKQKPSATAINWSSLKNIIKPRALNSHKGHFGHCLVVGGAKGMAGAAILSSIAAARCGSGKVSAWLENDSASLLARQPEIMCQNVPLNEIEQQINHQLSVDSKINSLVVGPGLGQLAWGKTWLNALFKNDKVKRINKLIDADGLNWLAQNPLYNQNWILTPHPREAARLLNLNSKQVNADRFGAAHSIAKMFGGVCVLKGAGSIISDANGRQFVSTEGNPGMASAGMGDVLSGIIGALLAQGLTLFDAAALGVAIHAKAADLAAGKNKHWHGLLASDLFAHLAPLLNPN